VSHDMATVAGRRAQTAGAEVRRTAAAPVLTVMKAIWCGWIRDGCEGGVRWVLRGWGGVDVGLSRWVREPAQLLMQGGREMRVRSGKAF